MRIAIAQSNQHVGDISGNADKVIRMLGDARDGHRARLVVFPELAVTGYPPEDLLQRPELYRQVERALAQIAASARGIDIIVGSPQSVQGRLYNCCHYLRDGTAIATYRKRVLPNYGVFDEKRHFTPGDKLCIVQVDGIPASLSICEDLWTPEHARESAQQGARLLININASPYHADKQEERKQLLAERARETGLAILYVNLIGGQDELVFDGGSLAIDGAGHFAFPAPQFTEGLFLMEIDGTAEKLRLRGLQPDEPALGRAESVYRALTLGVRDYVLKNRFPGVVVGLSGGIDSALTLCIAVDALGAERVQALLMPSRYTSPISIEDARVLCAHMGVRHDTISVEEPFQAFTRALAPQFEGLPADATEENIQARCRGILLMAISNKTGRMVLTTGNKSEMSVGYATLYGDMAGGFAPLKDVSKMLVYELARWRNRNGEAIPARTIERPPTAELRPDQKDEDSLPPYPVLDPILERYVELDQSPEEVIRAGFNPATVRRVASMVDRAEYKRRQAAPGIKISKRAFGRDRRYPITSGYRET